MAVVGDFNHVPRKHLNQYLDFYTREYHMLDLCYSNIADAYKAYKLLPLGASDHNAVQLVPTYMCKHSKSKCKQISLVLTLFRSTSTSR